MPAAAQERNLIPCAAVHLQEAMAEKLLEQPLSVHASGISVAHPEKARDPNARAVNRKHLGWGGEDAYFYDSRLAHPDAQSTCLMHGGTALAASALLEQWSSYLVCQTLNTAKCWLHM